MRISRLMAFWLRAALPVLALLLVATPPAFSYLYEQDVSTNRSVSQLRLTEIYLDTTPTLKIEWNYTGLGGLANPVFEVRRKLGASITTLGQTTNTYWVDSFTWSWNSNYVYEVRVVTDYQASMSLPAPPMGADPADIYMRQVASGSPWVAITVTPRYTTTTENQAVDSRLDLRYGSPTYKDFQFGSRIYRGGLFAGFANDPSKVGRSFVKFALPSMVTGTFFWTGSLNVYHTRNAKDNASSTATIGVHEVSDSWTESAIVWSNAPSLTPGDWLVKQDFIWDPGSPVSSWKHFTLREPVGLNIVGDGSVTFGLAAESETNQAWAYFAKSQWDSNYAPVIVYATGAPSTPLELLASPSPITGGNTATGTIYLNGFRGSPATINLSSSNTAAATVPATAGMSTGQISRTFNITTYTVGSPTTVTITATLNGYSETTTLTVNP